MRPHEFCTWFLSQSHDCVHLLISFQIQLSIEHISHATFLAHMLTRNSSKTPHTYCIQSPKYLPFSHSHQKLHILTTIVSYWLFKQLISWRESSKEIQTLSREKSPLIHSFTLHQKTLSDSAICEVVLAYEQLQKPAYSVTDIHPSMK